MSDIISVGLEIKNQEVRKDVVDAISSISGVRIQNTVSLDDCDILIMEIGEDLEKEFSFIHELQDVGAVSDIFLTSSFIEPDVLIRALRAGAREFFPQPIKKGDLINAFLKAKERRKDLKARELSRKKGKVITVVGSKGGIGTTTIAVNLASNLLEFKDICKSVVLLDMNLLSGEVPLFLDMQPAFNWGEVARNISRLDSTYLMSILSKYPSGLHVLPSPTGLDGVNAATPYIMERLLRLMRKEFDYIVIDSGQHLDDVSLKVLELSDTILIVSVLSLPCLVIVKRLLESFKRLGYPPDENTKIIINRYHKNSIISLKEAEKGLGKRIFWAIPNDFQTTLSAINQGKPLSAVAPKAEITRNMRELASKLASRTGPEKMGKSGLLGLKFSQAET